MLPNTHLVFYGDDLEMRGLFLDSLDKINLETEKHPKFLPGHRYVIVHNDKAANDDEQPFKIISNMGIHYGPRGENFFDFTKCPYLTTRDKIYFKFIYKKYERSITWLEKEEYEGMLPHINRIQEKLRDAALDTGISKRTGRPWYRLTFLKLKEVGDDIRDFCEKIDYIKTPVELQYTEKIRTKDRIKSSFEFFLSQEKGDIFGHDFETCYGFPMESPNFETVGLGIAHIKTATAVYYDLQWMQHEGKDGEYEYFLEYFKKWLDKFEDSVAYNHGYEQKVTYLMTKKLCLFDEGATINKLDGIVYKRMSLKYTVQRVEGQASWDDDFDVLTGDWLPELFGWNEETEEYEGHMTADGETTYDISDEDLDLMCKYRMVTRNDPNQVKERTETIQLEDLSEQVNHFGWTVTVPNDYKHNPVWANIQERWPDQVSEFEYLISKNWGEPFACIPSDIQCEYCCRDSFYAGLLKVDALQRYTKLCYDTYNHNLQLEAILQLTGFFCDEDLRLKMELQSLWMQVHGQINTTIWGLNEKLKWFKDYEIPDIPGITNLISEGYDPCSCKSIIMNHLSDTSESGLDEEALEPLLGTKILEIYKKYIKEYCYRIDESFNRSRKVYQEIDNELEEIYKPEYGDDYCQYTVDGKVYRINVGWDLLQEYYSTKTNYTIARHFMNQLKFSEIEKLMLPQLGKPNLPEKMYCPKNIDDIVNDYSINHENMIDYTLDDVVEFCDNAINLKSAVESPFFKFMAFNRFKGQIYQAYTTEYGTVPLGTVIDDEKLAELTETAKSMEYSLEWLERNAQIIINEDLDNLKTTLSWKRYLLNHDVISLLYSALMVESDEYDIEYKGKTYKTALFSRTFIEYDENGEPKFGWSKEVDEWYDTLGVELSGGFLDFALRYMGVWNLRKKDSMPEGYEGESDYEWFCHNIDNIDVEGNAVESLAKLNFCFQSFKKYNKVLTSYMRGEDFYTHNYNVSYFDENGITPNFYEEKGIHKCYIPFYANAKKSKRWSSGYHTIPSKAEMKKIVTTPPGFLMSYFDISGAEIRTISFMSQDDFMMNNYHKGLDPYITMARMTFPHDDPRYKDMSDEEYEDFLKGWRGSFKQVLLGSLYGMGSDKMADIAEISPEECEMVQEKLWSLAPKLKKFIEEKSTWAEEHPGYVQSALGDILELDDSDGEDRLARLGINQFIQNYSSVSLADGFMNNIEKSIHHRDEKLHDPDFILRPLGVVHDSCQIYFPTKYLFEIGEYYTRNLSGYLYDIHKILYAFDLEVGFNYYDVSDVKQLDPTHIEFKGNYTSLYGLVQKCRADGLQFRVTSLKTNPKHGEPQEISINGFEFGPEFKPKQYYSVVEQFYDYNGYAKYNEDKSKFKITFEKIV